MKLLWMRDAWQVIGERKENRKCPCSRDSTADRMIVVSTATSPLRHSFTMELESSPGARPTIASSSLNSASVTLLRKSVLTLGRVMRQARRNSLHCCSLVAAVFSCSPTSQEN